MGLFNLFKKKENNEKKCCCECGCNSKSTDNTQNTKDESGIKILGSGCAKCIELEENTKKAVLEMGLDFQIGHVTDFSEIASYGVMTTPALVLNGKVLSYGKVLSVDEIKEIFKNI